MDRYALIGTYDTRNNIEIIATADTPWELVEIRDRISELNTLMMEADRYEPGKDAMAIIELHLPRIDIVDETTGYVHEITICSIYELKEAGEQKEPESPRRLPTVTHEGKRYFMDERLREFRPTEPPLEFIPFDSARGRAIKTEGHAEGRTIDEMTLASIRNLVEYLHDDEKHHFEESERKEQEYHIFNDVQLVRKWLN
jgi:hypothetical protein